MPPRPRPKLPASPHTAAPEAAPGSAHRAAACFCNDGVAGDGAKICRRCHRFSAVWCEGRNANDDGDRSSKGENAGVHVCLLGCQASARASRCHNLGGCFQAFPRVAAERGKKRRRRWVQIELNAVGLPGLPSRPRGREGQPRSARSTRSGVMGIWRRRMPMARATALATAPAGGTIGTSPTPRTP